MEPSDIYKALDTLKSVLDLDALDIEHREDIKLLCDVAYRYSQVLKMTDQTLKDMEARKAAALEWFNSRAEFALKHPQQAIYAETIRALLASNSPTEVTEKDILCTVLFTAKEMGHEELNLDCFRAFIKTIRQHYPNGLKVVALAAESGE